MKDQDTCGFMQTHTSAHIITLEENDSILHLSIGENKTKSAF